MADGRHGGGACPLLVELVLEVDEDEEEDGVDGEFRLRLRLDPEGFLLLGAISGMCPGAVISMQASVSVLNVKASSDLPDGVWSDTVTIRLMKCRVRLKIVGTPFRMYREDLCDEKRSVED